MISNRRQTADTLQTCTPTSLGWEITADVVVVGAGAAALSAARAAAMRGLDVLLIVKGGPTDAATALAQGGLAAVLSADDREATHIDDTLAAGAGLCDPNTVHELVHAAPSEVRELRRLGAQFDSDAAGRLLLAREGGHSHRRIVHTADASGAEVSRQLYANLPAGVRVLRETALVDLALADTGTAAGVVAAHIGTNGELDIGLIRAQAVVLATGGYGQAWATTSNPRAITGDGLAAALRAGAIAQDLEFTQFHPTVLYTNNRQGHRPLITEALRGEGAVLIDAAGGRVMTDQHPARDLAPRDVVAAAMTERMRQAPGGVSSHLYLDATNLDPSRIRDWFPNVLAACQQIGLDPRHDPIPVAPGAHYSCGGIRADLDGRTNVTGLYAIGEVAATGVHGANRLASNSLTEALHTGRKCGASLTLDSSSAQARIRSADGWTPPSLPTVALQQAMSTHMSVLRSASGLTQLVDQLRGAVDGAQHPRTIDDLERRSLNIVASAATQAALIRTESRGTHRRADYPNPAHRWQGRIRVQAGDDALIFTFNHGTAA